MGLQVWARSCLNIIVTARRTRGLDTGEALLWCLFPGLSWSRRACRVTETTAFGAPDRRRACREDDHILLTSGTGSLWCTWKDQPC